MGTQLSLLDRAAPPPRQAAARSKSVPKSTPSGRASSPPAPPPREAKPDGVVFSTPGLAQMVVGGQKWLVVKTEPHDIAGRTVLVIADGQAWGTARLGAMRTLDLLDFRRAEGQHLIDDDLREEWAARKKGWARGPFYAWIVEDRTRFAAPVELAEPAPAGRELLKAARLAEEPSAAPAPLRAAPVSLGRVAPPREDSGERRQAVAKRDPRPDPSPRQTKVQKEAPVKPPAPKAAPAPAAKAAAPASAREGTLQVSATEAGPALELLVRSGPDSVIGWALEAGRPEGIDAAAVAKAFTVEGTRYLLPLEAGVPASPLGDRPASRMAKAADGNPALIDSVRVEPGLRISGPAGKVFELFLAGGAAAGRFIAKRVGEVWTARLTKDDLVPEVLSAEAVAAGWMPASGSAMPAALEEATPPEYRFWLAKGDGARACRDALVEAGIFRPASVRLVKGEARLVRVESRFFLVDPIPADPSRAAKARPSGFGERVAGLLPEFAGFSNPFEGGGDWRLRFSKGDTFGTVSVLSPPEATPELLREITEKARLARGDFLVEVPDSPAARAELAKVARPFVLSGPAGAGRLLAASFRLKSLKGVEWVDVPAEEERTEMDLQVVLASLAKGDRSNLFGAEVARVEKALRTAYAREMRIRKTAEERYVLGVVLEPLGAHEPDAQNDCYSSDEIKAACFKYMEGFQNVGHMHGTLVNGRVRLVENYLAPVDFELGGQTVRKGTWLQGLKVYDDGLWKDIREDRLTGLSIGGSAVRVPVVGPPGP